MSKITKIEVVENETYVYDPVCESPHSYVGNGFVNHNCCLWVDEIEKALAGSSSSGKTDGGTTSRVLSTFLTWMQEKTAPVFVVATANNHESIPPEFLRAGRFDEIFFVDLPNEFEREEIFSILLRKCGYNVKDFNLKLLATKTANFSGAEIEKAIDKAMLIGFADKKRKIKNDDIIKCVGEIKTLFTMRNDDFEKLRDWADTQCLKANSTEKADIQTVVENSKSDDLITTNTGRDLEVD